MWCCNMQMDMCACTLCNRRSETTSRALADELAIGKSYSKIVSACCKLTLKSDRLLISTLNSSSVIQSVCQHCELEAWRSITKQQQWHSRSWSTYFTHIWISGS